jgi:methionine-rich copper-binding protein CopC
MTLPLSYRGLTALVASVALLATAGAAAAHAHLVRSDPATGATVAAPKAIMLTFSEKLEGKFSSADLRKDGAPLGSQSLVDPKDGKILTVSPGASLSAGGYTVNWRVVSVDGHRTKGTVVFTVR